MAKVTFDYQTEVDLGFLSKREHPIFEDVVILNYTDECVYEKRWNEVTMQCRGLIVNEKTLDILSRCFPKFFNYGENPGFELKIPAGKPTVSIKLDGSLGISYIIDNQVYWATRGSFVSDQAAVANHIWTNKYSHIDIEKLKGITLLVEIIDKETRVVVDYQGDSDLVLIGAVRIEDGYDYSYHELSQLASEIGLRVTSQVEMSVEEALKRKNEIDYNEEGWVLRWDNGFRLKVKGDKYLEVHKLLYGLSEKKKVEFWSLNKLDELIRQVPEEFRIEIEEFSSLLDAKLEIIQKEVSNFHKSVVSKGISERKEYAAYVLANGKREYTPFYFQLFDGREPNYREFIYKNYREMLGVE